MSCFSFSSICTAVHLCLDCTVHLTCSAHQKRFPTDLEPSPDFMSSHCLAKTPPPPQPITKTSETRQVPNNVPTLPPCAASPKSRGSIVGSGETEGHIEHCTPDQHSSRRVTHSSPRELPSTTTTYCTPHRRCLRENRAETFPPSSSSQMLLLGAVCPRTYLYPIHPSLDS